MQAQVAVAVIDLDNILHRGVDRHTGRARPQGLLDVLGLARALKAAGVTAGTVCRNRPFSPLAEITWRSLGLTVQAAGENCDRRVMEAAERHALEHPDATLILVAGDGDYCPMVRNLRMRGVTVEVWSRSRSTSRSLARLAASVRWIDCFLEPGLAAAAGSQGGH